MTASPADIDADIDAAVPYIPGEAIKKQGADYEGDLSEITAKIEPSVREELVIEGASAKANDDIEEKADAISRGSVENQLDDEAGLEPVVREARTKAGEVLQNSAANLPKLAEAIDAVEEDTFEADAQAEKGWFTIEGDVLTRVNLPNEVSELRLPEGVKFIGKHVFEGSASLKKVIFSSSIKTVSSFAFYNCTNLVHVVLNGKLEEIGFRAFSATGIQGLKLPASVRKLGVNAFSNCNNLSKIERQGSEPMEVAQFAFAYCKSLPESQQFETTEPHVFFKPITTPITKTSL